MAQAVTWRLWNSRVSSPSSHRSAQGQARKAAAEGTASRSYVRPTSENVSRSVVLPYGAMALARPVCGGPDGTSALWPVPEAERGPRAPGGETVLPGPTPDPARCLPLGHLAAGLLQQHARVEARSKGKFSYILSREHHLAAIGETELWRALSRRGRMAG
jgi:hypothetical protein